MRLCSSKLTLNESLERRTYRTETAESNQLVEILVVSSRDIVWRLTELVNFLVCLVDLSDKLKFDIYELEDLRLHMNRILFNGNLVEKEHVLKLIWKLTVDQRVANAIKHDIDLYSYIIGLSLNMQNKSKLLLRYSNYILFALNTETLSANKKYTYKMNSTFTSTTSSDLKQQKYSTDNNDEYLQI